MKPLDALLILVSILFATGFIVDQRWGPERRQHRQKVRYQQARLELLAEGLRKYGETADSFPSTEEGLDAIHGLAEPLLSGEFEALRPFLGMKGGIRDFYGVPYVYENRREGEQAQVRVKFRASPANIDRHKRPRWSRRIEKGVYISSIGLRHDAERVFGRAWLDALLLFFGGVIVFLAIAYIIARNQRDGDRVRGINAMILVGVAILLSVVIGLTSGGKALSDEPLVASVPTDGSPRVDLLEEYLAVLRSFAAAGVYDPIVFEQRAESLRAEFGVSGEVSGETVPQTPAAPKNGEPKDD